MLVLLLRLRQVCSHPALIKTMLDTTDSESMGSEDAKIDDANDMDLISKMSTMTLGTESDNPKKEEENFFTHTNPVFDQENISSKMKYIIDEVKKVIDLGQKAVVVSQWTSMLEVFANHFHKMRIRCHTIAGNVPLKVRTTIVEDFNTNPNGKPVNVNSAGSIINIFHHVLSIIMTAGYPFVSRRWRCWIKLDWWEPPVFGRHALEPTTGSASV